MEERCAMEHVEYIRYSLPKPPKPESDYSVLRPGPPPDDANAWFAQRFPKATELYGPAFLVATVSQGYRPRRFYPLEVNEDLLAGIIGGDPLFKTQVVYSAAEDQWYCFDYLVEAFCPVSEEKLKLLASNYLIRCA